MKFAHMICGLVAAFAFPVAASAKEDPVQPAAAATAAPAAQTNTLFPGNLDIPVVSGSSVPASCDYPASLSNAAGYDLACVQAAPGDEADVGYIAWLGEHGWRHAADIEGGIVAVQTTEDGCERELNMFMHGGNTDNSGIWFALRREPQCGAQ